MINNALARLLMSDRSSPYSADQGETEEGYQNQTPFLADEFSTDELMDRRRLPRNPDRLAIDPQQFQYNNYMLRQLLGLRFGDI